MGLIEGYAARRDSWKAIDMVKLVADIMQQHADAIAGYNRRQLLQGLDKDGKIFKRYHSRLYAAKKHRQNQQAGEGVADFFLTGAFQKSIFLKTDGDKYMLDATDSKRDKLVAMSSTSIFGLQEENQHLVWIEVLRPPLLPVINKLTGATLT